MADLSNESRECAVKEIGKLINAIEGADTCFGGLFHEPKQYPNFLGPKGPRYKRDLETLPLITFIPVLEIRPTASKQIKDQDVSCYNELSCKLRSKYLFQHRTLKFSSIVLLLAVLYHISLFPKS